MIKCQILRRPIFRTKSIPSYLHLHQPVSESISTSALAINQTWQWKMDHLQMIFPLQPPFTWGFPSQPCLMNPGPRYFNSHAACQEICKIRVRMDDCHETVEASIHMIHDCVSHRLGWKIPVIAIDRCLGLKCEVFEWENLLLKCGY